ncbi:MAG TPA: glycosyltransferase family 39 protein [Candidatus Angelobacter sp.]|nr:glycosyltransferase family 39 protein [Candidatus Angelobacter sp.]
MTAIALPRVGAGLRVRATPYALGVAGITVVALLIRVIALGHQPLGGDESFTAVVSRRAWLDMYAAVRNDSAAPLPYALTHLASSLSNDPAMLRLPAALAGTAAVPLLAALGRRLGGVRAGLWAAAAAAVLPALVLPARDARMYALAGTLVLAATLTLWRAVERPSRPRLAVHAAVVAAAMLSDYFVAFAVVAELLAAVLVLRASRPTMLRVTAATVAGCALLLLWLPFATAQFHHAQQAFWLDGIGFAGAVGGVLRGFFGGPPVDANLPQHSLLVALQGVGIAGAGVAVLAGMPRIQRAAGAYVVACGLGAAVLIGLASAVHPVLDERYVSVVWTPLFAVVGLGLSRLRWAAPPAIAAIACASIAMCALPTRAAIADVVREQLDGHVTAGDLVVASPDTYMQVLAAGDGDVTAHTHVLPPAPPWYFGLAAYPPGAFIDAVPATANTVDVVTQPGDHQPRLPAGHTMVRRTCATMVCVTVYAPAP